MLSFHAVLWNKRFVIFSCSSHLCQTKWRTRLRGRDKVILSDSHASRVLDNSIRSSIYRLLLQRDARLLSTLLSIWRTSRNNLLKETFIGAASGAMRWTFTGVHVHSKNQLVSRNFLFIQAILLKQSLPRSMLINVSINITIFFLTFDSHFFSLFSKKF